MMRARRVFSGTVVAAIVATMLVMGGGAVAPAAAAEPVAGEPLTGSGVVTRTGNAQKPSSVFQSNFTTNPGGVAADPTIAFGLPANAAPPQHQFNRTLRIDQVVQTNSAGTLQNNNTGASAVYPGDFNYYTSALTWAQYLPYTNWAQTGSGASLRYNYYLDQQFVQHGSYLIPTVRGLQSPGIEVGGAWRGSLDYNIIWGVGRSWSEIGDAISGTAASRAAIPFTLVNQEENCSFNGLLTFLYTDSAISRVHYQVASETCAYFKGNMWGNLPGATVAGSTVPEPAAEAIREAFTEELANRMETRPLSQLPLDYPAAGFDLAALTQGVTSAQVTAYGFVYKGVNYVSDCVVRTTNTVTNAGGVHPFCDQVHLPSYSTAKSIFMGGALMWLAEKYGDELLSEKVSDWVPEVPASWATNNVTIGHLVDMATGHYDAAGNQVDEAGSRMLNFFSMNNRTRASMMAQATGFPFKEAPGQRWVYHSSDSFILAAAMNAYLKDQEGASADVWSDYYREVLAPIGVDLDSQITERTKTADGGLSPANRYNPSGTPWGGFGLWWNRDNIAKIGDFFNNGKGQIDGDQVLNAEMLAASLQRDPADRGLATATDPFVYNNSFWGRMYTSADNAAYTDDFWVPFMSGFGGISVAMMPNCSTFWRVSDNSEFSWAPVVAESNKLDPMSAPSDAECAPVLPVATSLMNDSGTVDHGDTVVIDVLANDGTSPVLTPATLRLVDAANDDALVTSLIMPQGTFTVTEDHKIRFAAAGSFLASATVTVTYSVGNAEGMRSTANVAIALGASQLPPTLENVVAPVVAHGGTTLIDVLAGAGAPGELPIDPSTLRLLDGTDEVLTHTVTGQGTYSIESGQVRFTALTGFTGTSTVHYRVQNTEGVAGSASISVPVAAATAPPSTTPPSTPRLPVTAGGNGSTVLVGGSARGVVTAVDNLLDGQEAVEEDPADSSAPTPTPAPAPTPSTDGGDEAEATGEGGSSSGGVLVPLLTAAGILGVAGAGVWFVLARRKGLA